MNGNSVRHSSQKSANLIHIDIVILFKKGGKSMMGAELWLCSKEIVHPSRMTSVDPDVHARRIESCFAVLLQVACEGSWASHHCIIGEEEIAQRRWRKMKAGGDRLECGGHGC